MTTSSSHSTVAPSICAASWHTSKATGSSTSAISSPPFAAAFADGDDDAALALSLSSKSVGFCAAHEVSTSAAAVRIPKQLRDRAERTVVMRYPFKKQHASGVLMSRMIRGKSCTDVEKPCP